MASVRASLKRAAFLLSSSILVLSSLSFFGLGLGRAAAASLAVDGSVKTHQTAASQTITSGALSTTQSNDLVVAFVASDGPNSGNGISFSSVTGGGLTWKLRERTNAQPGTAEIWEAVAPTPLSSATVTATRNAGAYIGSIVVVAFSGASTNVDGAVATGNGATGAPAATLTTTRAGSWVWGVGNDFDNAIARTVGAGQTKFDEDLSGSGDTYWVQSQNAANNLANTAVTINDTAPTNDHWNLSTIEIIPAVVDTTPPSQPTNLAAVANNSNQVGLSWTASTDDVGVAGYQVSRNGTAVANVTAASYTDNGVSPSTTYSYTVEAFDASGNFSTPSNGASVTTPAASVNPPVISSMNATNVTQTGATITWQTDIPSSSQVSYGTSPSYGQSTTLDNSQVTSHSQALSGLTPGTTYHFAVTSTGSNSNSSTSGDNTFATPATNVTLPDMQIEVPTNAISIGSSGGQRQLQFTHITWDAGSGPFEIDPNYDSKTGTATFTQALYNSSSPGVWNFDHSVPVPVTATFDPPFNYRFPLTRFTLNTVNPDGSPGSVVATSPKVDYCITGDTFVGGVPNTPNETFIPASDCNNPALPLGWSVGWGDAYDQTDPGQPISLAGVPDGTYVLHAMVDPNHVLTESNPNNNVTDTTIQISGSTVTVLSQTNPGSTPPTVSISSPANGSNVSGTVTLQAMASATSPATVSSVQFLLDNQPLGSTVTSAPYNFAWTVGSTPVGNHTISARVTDSTGNVATAQPITVNVVNNNPPPPPDTTPPTVSLINPANNQTVSGTIPVAANASDNVAVASVQFFLDGQPLGSAVTSSPYAVNWDTTTAANGSHTLSAQAVDTSGNIGTATNVTVTVQNPAQPPACFVLQAQQSVHANSGTATTPSFHTAMAGETLLAFVSADGPAGAGKQTATVSGAGLTWTLVKRSNAQSGDAEVWQATAASVIPNATVSSVLSKSSYGQDLTVIAMEGTNGVGASAAGAATTGAPTVALRTTATGSLVFSVGHDWSRAVARTLPAGWTMLDQWVNTAAGDTFWSQYTNDPTGAAGSTVTVSDTAPTNDQWNLVAVELTPDAG